MERRTDLAMEAKELWQEQAGETTQLPGVRARETKNRGITTTVVEILDRRGARALQKPAGTYVTLELERNLLREPLGFRRAAVRLGRALAAMIPRTGPVLVVGLGNAAVTPDAIGPRTMEHLVVTRHLGSFFPQLRPVSAVCPGVLGVTGLEAVEIVRGVVERVAPCCVVAVDALASRAPSRVCSTVQLSDTGIVPGAGVGNRRAALNRQTLGVPVVAVGVPTVVDISTLIQDIVQENDQNNEKIEMICPKGMIVTPRDIDARTAQLARLLGYGLSLGLHRGLSMEDVLCFVG